MKAIVRYSDNHWHSDLKVLSEYLTPLEAALYLRDLSEGLPIGPLNGDETIWCDSKYHTYYHILDM